MAAADRPDACVRVGAALAGGAVARVAASSAVEAMARFVPMVVAPSAPAPPEGLRRYLMDTLSPDSEVSEDHPCERSRRSRATNHRAAPTR